jgi:large-conductance mechanosensitive channel
MSKNFQRGFELEKQTFNLFKTNDFRNFLVDNKLIVTVVGFVLASNMNVLINSFYDNILLVCKEDITKSNIDDECKSIIDYINEYKITIINYNIYIGKFIISILKFIISIIIAFYISRLLNDILN